jgi:hypothetical protein
MSAIGAALFVGLTTVRLDGHHNMVAEFSTNQPVSLRGTVTKIEWINPHGWIHLTITNESGHAEDWAVETGSPFAMQKRGLQRTDFKVGIEIIVSGYAARDKSRTVAGMVVTFTDRDTSSTNTRQASFALGR